MPKKRKNDIDLTEQKISSIVIDSEYQIAKRNQDMDNTEFDSLIDMLECRRNEKDYDWMSDVFIPETVSIILTEASGWANQYFQSRDFVEVLLNGDKPNDKMQVRAAKNCINKTLNDRDIYYFPKYIRRRLITALLGRCYVLCWWEQDVLKEDVKLLQPVVTGVDFAGKPIMGQREVDGVKETITRDHFNFDVLDPRNVFTDTKYCYSAQLKDWITVRSEMCYEELKEKEKVNQYVNLSNVKDAIIGSFRTTETSKETYNKDSNKQDIEGTPIKYFDVLDRYGKFWAIIEEKDEFGNPTKVKPGIDSYGLPLDNAEMLQVIITFAMVGNKNIMIRFIPTPFIDATGKPFLPIVRGLCYIHPTKDEGLSDGKYMRELQIAINDTYNMTSDRTKLATLPTFKGRKYSLEDNNTVYIEPEHVIELEDTKDLEELVVRDNIIGAMNQLNMLTSKMQQVTSVYPTTMGGLPDKASTTATAVAGSETRSNARANYKSLTDEYTFNLEFYWMILQMTYRFMKDKTAYDMLGEDAPYFNATQDYTYTPVTSNIESEYNKQKKIQLYDQTVGRLSGLIKGIPELMPVLAHIVGRQLELQGDEYQEIGKMIDKLSKAKFNEEAGKGEDVKNMKDPAMSNQNGQPMSNMEMGARENVMPGGGIIK